MLNLIANILTGRLKAQARQRAIVATLIAAAVLLVVVALAHALSALRTWLAARYDLITADLIVGGGFLVAAAILAIAAKIVASRRPPVDESAALTGALAPMALALFANRLRPQGEGPEPAQDAPRAAEAASAEKRPATTRRAARCSPSCRCSPSGFCSDASCATDDFAARSVAARAVN